MEFKPIGYILDCGDHPRTILVKIDLNWTSGFREDKNVKS
jgi:hypothetical protein